MWLTAVNPGVPAFRGAPPNKYVWLSEANDELLARTGDLATRMTFMYDRGAVEGRQATRAIGPIGQGGDACVRHVAAAGKP